MNKNDNNKVTDPEKDIFIRVVEFGLRHPKGFTFSEVIGDQDLGLLEWEKDIVKRHLENAFVNARETEGLGKGSYSETMFLRIKGGNNSFHNRNYCIGGCFFNNFI